MRQKQALVSKLERSKGMKSSGPAPVSEQLEG